MTGFYRRLKLKHKLFFILSLQAIIFSLLGLGALNVGFHIYDGQLYHEAAKVLNFSSINVETKLHDIQNLSYDIITNTQIQEYLTMMQEAETTYDKYHIREKLEDKLAAYAFLKPYILSVIIMDTHQNRYRGGLDIHKSYHIKLQNIQRQAAQREGASLWVDLVDNEPIVICARQIRAIKELSLESLGTLIITIDPEKLIDKSPAYASNYKSDIVILSSKNIVLKGDKPFTFEQLKPFIRGRQGYGFKKINGENYLVAYMTSQNTHWTYLNILRYDNIFQGIRNMRNIMILSYLGIFILVIYIGIKFAKSITRPLEKLTDDMKIAESGNFEGIQAIQSDSNSRKDEIGMLEDDFRLMLQKINILINENYLKQIRVKEAELKALQAQINPHFLYNTLDSINWLAKVNKQHQIAAMVKSLGQLMRASISEKEHLIPLSREIILLESYICIQKIRYEDRLAFHMNIEEAVQACVMPKLTLQPIVENSIHYGLEKLLGVCTISVEAYKKQDMLYIDIIDNGPGMDEAFLDKLRKGQIEPQGSGIGLKNINERIKIVFGPSYGLSVDSKINEGTRVCIKMPCRKESEYV